MEQEPISPAQPVQPVPVNPDALVRLYEGRLEKREENFAWWLIRRKRNWREAWDRLFQEREEAKRRVRGGE